MTRLLPRVGASLAGLSPRDEVGSRKCGPFLICPNLGLCQAAENAERRELLVIPVRKKIFGLGF